jgi:hypothetical protein
MLRFSEFCEALERDGNRPNKKRAPKKYGQSAMEPESCSRYDASKSASTGMKTLRRGLAETKLGELKAAKKKLRGAT